jgi:hypothetical protein
MKQILLSLLFIPFFSFSNNIEISKLSLTNEGNFITYKILKEESIADIAKKFCIKTEMLIQFNNLRFNADLKINQTLSIPLTETNYFKLNGIKNSAGYIPIYYYLESNTIKKNLCLQLNVLVETFDKWNHTEYTDNLISGEDFFVGWLKIDTNTQINQLPVEIINKEKASNNDVKFENFKMQPSHETISKNTNSDIKSSDKKNHNPIQKNEQEVVLSRNPKEKKKLKNQFLSSLNTIYHSIFTNKVLLKKEEKPTINPVKIEEIVVKEKTKENVESKISSEKAQEFKDFVSSKNGNASLFYAGNSNGKFYVVTNIAAKGKTVKVTNIKNGKYLMAEVISVLSNKDVGKGLLIKLSDNSKSTLGITTSVFYVKVNY